MCIRDSPATVIMFAGERNFFIFVLLGKLLNIMQDHNSKNQEDLILKLDQDRAWLLENLDKGKWSEIRNELADLERKISKLIIRVQETYLDT